MQSSVFPDLSTEPSVLCELTHEQRDRLTNLLDQYLSNLDDGVPPDASRLLMENRDLAEPLTAYLSHLNALHEVAAGFCHPSVDQEGNRETGQGDEKRLGDFILQEEIGRGGMGVVYEAKQISLDRQVALKVLPFAAVLDSKQIARFKNEAQAAAQVQHPNIVPVFAVGAERGVHYYAMQLIDGQPLDRVIDEMRSPETGGEPATGANPPARSTQRTVLTKHSGSRAGHFRTVAKLGIQAAEALHAAHEYGVVHRDIKPSNLLLDDAGKLWVADFGLAHSQSEGALTKTGDVVGTVRYMSPEQAAGKSALVDQRTDVYSLGATLYELLTLRAAFVGENVPEFLRQIEKQDPPAPRQFCPQVPSDLETVILKAMSKGKDERYATAAEFAADLRRFLEGKPTIARPPTLLDRAGKWARRHKQIVSIATAVCLLLVIGLSVSTALIARAQIQTASAHGRAVDGLRDARGVLELGEQLAEKLKRMDGFGQLLNEYQQRSLSFHERFVERAANDPLFREDVAWTYVKIGAIKKQIGSQEDVLVAHRQALLQFQQLHAAEPNNIEHRRQLALCQNDLGLSLSETGRVDAAAAAFQAAMRIQEALIADFPNQPQYQAELAFTKTNLAFFLSQTGRLTDAKRHYQETVSVQRKLLEADPDNAELLRQLAATYNNVSSLFAIEHPETALACYANALQVYDRLIDVECSVWEHRNAQALTYNNIGAAQARSNQLREAEASYDRAIDIQQELVDAAPGQKTYQSDLALSHNNLGLVQSKRGVTEDSVRSFQEARRIQQELLQRYPSDLNYRSSLGGIDNNLGIVLEESGRDAVAAEAFVLAAKSQQVALDAAPTSARFRTFLSKHYFNYGRVLRKLGRPKEAAETAIKRRGLWHDDPRKLFSVAEELALAVEMLRTENAANSAAESCADLAVATIELAVQAGWKPPDGGQWPPAFHNLQRNAILAAMSKRN